MKYRFSEKFENQLIAALNGSSGPWRSQMENPYEPIPPTEPQVNLLRKLNYTDKVESKAEISG